MISRLSSFLFVMTVLLSSSWTARAGTLDRVLATVDDEVITLSNYHFFVRSLGIPEKPDAVDEEALKKMMEERVILHEAKRKGVEVGEGETDKMIEELRKSTSLSQADLERELKKEGLEMREYRRLLKERLTAVRLVESEVDSKVFVTDKEVEDYYRANEEEFSSGPEKAVLKAIFLRLNEDATVTEITDLKRKALKIMAQLEEGESFEALVARYDDDHLRSERGRWGEFDKGSLIPPLDEKVFSMKVGETSGPLWVSDGVYILRLEDKTGGGTRPLKEVGAGIKRHLQQQKREKLFNEWMKTLWEKASIKVN